MRDISPVESYLLQLICLLLCLLILWLLGLLLGLTLRVVVEPEHVHSGSMLELGAACFTEPVPMTYISKLLN